jgi:outer membrane receptor protein involved in Fe transport
LRFGVEGGKNWEAALFVENLFDRLAETSLPVAISADLPTTRRIAVNRPRTIGIDARWSF